MTRSDIQHLLKKLFPPGTAWFHMPGSLLNYLIEGIAEEFYRIHLQIGLLIYNTFPSTSSDLLSAWETEFGIPNEQFTTQHTTDIRRNQVLTRFSFSGENIIPNREYYKLLGQLLGYNITAVDDISTEQYLECGVSYLPVFLGEGGGSDICIIHVDGSAANGARLESAFNDLRHIDIFFQFVYSE